MRIVLTLIGFLLILLHVPGLASELQDQGIGHRIGVSFPPGESTLPESRQLQTLQNAGVTLVEVDGSISMNQAATLADAGFYLFLRQNRSFTTHAQITAEDSLFFARDRELLSQIQTVAGSRLAAFAPFRYPDERNEQMLEGIALYANRLLQELPSPPTLYYLSAFQDVASSPAPYGFQSFRITSDPDNAGARPVIHYSPDNHNPETLILFRDILAYTLTQENSILIVDYYWLAALMEQFEPLAQTLQAYTSNNEILFPFPAPAEESPILSWPVLFFLAVFGFWLIHYQSNPAYRRSLFRYLTSHKFFIEDIMEHRVRMPYVSLFLFTFHMLLTGIFAYLAAGTLFSSLGRKALESHFPWLEQIGSEPFGFFFWGLLLSFTIQLLSLIWLHLPAFRSRSIGQTQRFYGWPLQLNFPVILLLIGFIQADASLFWIRSCLILFPLIWFLSFYFAAFDTARTHPKPLLYILITCGLHLSLSLLLFYLMIYTPAIWQPIQLALSLP